jgi:hypothetical protein
VDEHDRISTIIHSAQDTLDAWRRNPNRRTLNDALTKAAEEYHRLGILTNHVDRQIFGRVGHAIQANLGHGYTNPRRLIELAQELGANRQGAGQFIRQHIEDGARRVRQISPR